MSDTPALTNMKNEHWPELRGAVCFMFNKPLIFDVIYSKRSKCIFDVVDVERDGPLWFITNSAVVTWTA